MLLRAAYNSIGHENRRAGGEILATFVCGKGHMGRGLTQVNADKRVVFYRRCSCVDQRSSAAKYFRAFSSAKALR